MLSHFDLEGGVSQKRVWEDTLQFKRISWYQQTSLVYDLSWVKLDRKSPFYYWLSAGEKRIADSCAAFYIALDYTLDAVKLSHMEIKSQLQQQHIEEVPIKNFITELRNHPQYRSANLGYYKIRGYCSKRIISSQIKIKLPGFQEVTL